MIRCLIAAITILYCLSTKIYVKNFSTMHLKRTNTDLILSSGFLAFARHAGVIAAIEDSNCFNINRVVGTSSGSLAGSMLAAGLTSEQISHELSKQRPIKLLSPVLNPKNGIFSLRSVIKHLKTILPQDFNQLKIPLAVGVIDFVSKEFSLISEGDLPEAVAASCAIPLLFKPVAAGNPPRLYADGGVADRTGISHWKTWKVSSDATTDTTTTSPTSPQRKLLVHLINSSSRYEDSSKDSIVEDANTLVFKTPRARANFVSLKDFETQRLTAYKIAIHKIFKEESDSFMSRYR